jgi:hypothetical protein
VNPVRTGGEGDVQPVVDEYARPSPSYGLDRLRHEREQGTAGHVSFANLDQMDARSRSRGNPSNQGSLWAVTEAPAIRDHADDRMHAEVLLFGCRVGE